MAYAELHCLSNFSFLQGASHPEELVQQARNLGYQALALTDECSVAGVVRAHAALKSSDALDSAKVPPFKLIIGSEFRLADGLTLVLLCPNRQAYGQLSRLITLGRRRADKGSYRLTLEDFRQGLDDCLLLWKPEAGLANAEAVGRQLKHWFPERLWLLQERLLLANEATYLTWLEHLAQRLSLPRVAAGHVHMHCAERQPLQDVLSAIRLGCPIQHAGLQLFPNRERHLRPLDKLKKLYSPELLQETLKIAELCHFSLDELRYEYPEDLVPSGYTAAQYLRQLTEEGVRRRYPAGAPVSVCEQIEKELRLVAELRYEHYFLTVQDIVAFARSRNILCQGRGSAANSAVCYCLGITEVDPARVNLLLERFISKERHEPPDIDVDFEHERREEVIQYIYRRYGRERAALAATVITYRGKSAIRDVGKALGMDLEQLEYLIANLDWRDGKDVWLEQLRQLGLQDQRGLGRHFARLVREIIGFPRHLSQHVGGFVIASRDLSELVPIENAAMPERTVIQWDKDDLESLRLLKVDVLALGMLSAIRRALELVSADRKQPMDLSRIPPEDPATYAMLQRGDSVGVFQVESRAQINMLPRLRPKCFYDLVIQVAIVRPGPIQGDMVHPYLRRRQDLEPVEYPSLAVRGVLERTLGVPLFQEQVIELAMVAAGFSGGEADALRRAMAAWKRSGQLEGFHAKLIQGMLARGYSLEFGERLWREISGFGEYGFPESHAASFALLVYSSAWLKCHEPAAFYCALLNSQPMGFYSPSQLIQDARRHQVEVLPVDINASSWDHSLDGQRRNAQDQPALRLGLRLVKGLRREAAQQLLEARPTDGYRSLPEVRQRAGLRAADLEVLASAGALRAVAAHRYQARWEILGVEEPRPLFSTAPDSNDLEASMTSPPLAPPSEGETILEDYQSLGLSLERHPLCLLREQGLLNGCLNAEALTRVAPNTPVTVAGLVVMRQRPGTASGVTFVTLEDETGTINLVVWLNTARAQRKPLLTARLLKVKGILEREGDIIHVVAGKLIDLSPHLQALRIPSRDFH